MGMRNSTQPYDRNDLLVSCPDRYRTFNRRSGVLFCWPAVRAHVVACAYGPAREADYLSLDHYGDLDDPIVCEACGRTAFMRPDDCCFAGADECGDEVRQ